jgi:membrane protein
MKRYLKASWELTRDTYAEFTRDNAARLAAAIAFYAVFSVAPLLIIATAIAGFVFGPRVAMVEAADYLQQFFDAETTAYILQLVERWQDPRAGVFATILGVGTLLWASYRLFMALQDTLNMIWGVRPRDNISWKSWIRMRLLPFAMVLLIGLLLFVALVASAVVSAVTQFFGELVPMPTSLVALINFGVSFGLVTLLFAMVFKVLPDANVKWRDVWVGALLTAFLFAVGQSLIGLYLGYTSTSSIFGAAGSLVVLLFWVYFSAQIFFLGAEFTQVYARRLGERIEPSEDAVRVNHKLPEAEQAERA